MTAWQYGSSRRALKRPFNSSWLSQAPAATAGRDKRFRRIFPAMSFRLFALDETGTPAESHSGFCPGLLAQDHPDLPGQSSRGKRLLEESRVGINNTVVNDCIVGVP